ncbi:MAG: CGNR zinc finger domain-containing protein [Vulcanimicrobiaceae bacterium]
MSGDVAGETGSKAAPGGLATVQAFVNSVELETGREALGSPEGLAHWLSGHGLLEGTPSVGESDLRLALEVREALRRVLLSNNGAPADTAALATLSRLARSAQLSLLFGPGAGVRLESNAPGVDGALGRLLTVVFEAMIDGRWTRLKACAKEGCRWAFYDRSRNRSGTWCSMAVCGNQHKAQRFRRRGEPHAS